MNRPDTSKPSSTPRPRTWWLLLLLLCIFSTYVIYVSAGTIKHWHGYGHFYDLQAEGFRLGQLSMKLTPAPELLAAADPHDPINRRYWHLDTTYYKGRLFAYWGPLPALVQAIVKSLLRVRGVVGDQYLVVAGLCLAAIGGSLILYRAQRRLFPNTPTWLGALAILAFTLANPTLSAASTASTYITAILWAQACLILGLVPAFDCVWAGRGARGNSRRYWVAGLAWGLAVACRVTVLPAIPVLGCLTVLLTERPTRKVYKPALGALLRIATPVALVGCALLLYNKLRFDAWLEFGTSYQLSGYPLFRLSWQYVPYNLYAYLFQPVDWDCGFPFVFQMPTSDLPEGITTPKDYMLAEPVTGWLRVVPATWLIPLGFLLVPRDSSQRVLRTHLFCLFTFACLATLPGLTTLGLYLATLRYLGDVSYGLVLLGTFSGLALVNRSARPSARWAAQSAVVALFVATVGISAGIGYGGHATDHFEHHNPRLHARLTQLTQGITKACRRW